MHGGQGLRVVRLHDVAQEPHPELLGAAGRGCNKQQPRACGPHSTRIQHILFDQPSSNPQSPREAHWADNPAALANCDDQFLCQLGE